MKYEEVVKYMANKYPDYSVQQIAAIATEWFDGYTDGKIAGKIEAIKCIEKETECQKTLQQSDSQEQE